MASILLVIPPFLIRAQDGTVSPAESDIFVHLRDSLQESGVTTIVPEWGVGQRRLTTTELERLVVEHKCEAILVEASYPRPESCLAEVDMGRLSRHTRIAAVVTDLWFSPGITDVLRSFAGLVERFLIFGNADLIEPIVERGRLDPALVRQFHDLGGIPVPRRASAEKTVDFCYLGTAKKFRGRLLKSIVGDAHVRSFICTAGREGRIGTTGLERIASYMDVLACSKTGLWTRAGESVRLNGRTYAGGFTGRFNEYLAASVVPLYWGVEKRFGLTRPDTPPVSGLQEGLHYIRVRDGLDLKLKARRICHEPEVYERLRCNIDELYQSRFSSRIITGRLLSVLGMPVNTGCASLGV